MNITLPKVDDIVSKYSTFNPEPKDLKAEYEKLSKAELVDLLVEAKGKQRTDTVQELAKAILKDEEFLAASYEQIAEAIRQIKPEAKTSSKSIASYVSKKKAEWELPPRFRITGA
jgi:hypothetical protein